MKVAWIIYVIFAGAIGVGGLASYMNAQSAPQQATAALFSLASVGVPFLFLSGIKNLIALEDAKEAKEAQRQANIREAMAANPPGAPSR